jgi:hypothetical protein
MKFLSGETLLRQVRQLLRKSTGTTYFAVAFWGKGAIQSLRLDKAPSDLRVICNLTLGGTNPNEIKDLLANKAVKVKHSTMLHAKVYWSDKMCIVGSANASANGLGWEGKEARQMIEAGILLDHPKTVKEIGEWLKRLWTSSQTVKTADIELATLAWELARQKRPPKDNSHGSARSLTLREALSKDFASLNDRRVFVRWMIGDDRSTESKKAEAVKRKTQKLFAKHYEPEELTTNPRGHRVKPNSLLISAQALRTEPARPSHWSLDDGVWFMGDWNETPELRDKLTNGYSNYWYRQYTTIPPSITQGPAIRLSKADRTFLRDAICQHAIADDHLKDNDMCVEIGAFLRWCEINCKERLVKYLSGVKR